MHVDPLLLLLATYKRMDPYQKRPPTFKYHLLHCCLSPSVVTLAQQRPSVGAACVLRVHAEVLEKLVAEAIRRHKGDTPTLWSNNAFNKLSLLSQKLHRAS